MEFNGNYTNIKLVANDEMSSALYVNDKKIATYNYEHFIIYVTDKFMIISWPGATCGELVLGYINEELGYSDMDISIFNTDQVGLYRENNKILQIKQ